MRIPLAIFLAVWALFMLVFLVASILTVHQARKYAIRGSGATVSTALFMGVAAVALILTILYFMTVDWNQIFRFGGAVTPSPYISL